MINGQRRLKLTEIFDPPKLKPLDVVVSSFGRHPFELRRNEDQSAGPVGPVLTRRLHEAMGQKFEGDSAVPGAPVTNEEPEPYYRRWVKPGR